MGFDPYRIQRALFREQSDQVKNWLTHLLYEPSAGVIEELSIPLQEMSKRMRMPIRSLNWMQGGCGMTQRYPYLTVTPAKRNLKSAGVRREGNR
jgi:hypothetical protein